MPRVLHGPKAVQSSISYIIKVCLKTGLAAQAGSYSDLMDRVCIEDKKAWQNDIDVPFKETNIQGAAREGCLLGWLSWVGAGADHLGILSICTVHVCSLCLGTCCC